MNEINSIIESVDKSIEKLQNDFRSNPTLFFTENDIVCYFYSILKQELQNIKIQDIEGDNHLLIHAEYPTPFRCDMSGNNFEIKSDNAQTKKGGKYGRGHYDLVVLNPKFIGKYPYEIIKAQDYEAYKEKVLSNENNKPLILYGLEFMYSRDPIKPSRGNDKERAVKEFVAKVRQDAKKLRLSKDKEFINKIKMLVFIKGSEELIRSKITPKLAGNDIILCFSKEKMIK